MKWFNVFQRDRTVRNPLLADTVEYGRFQEDDFKSGRAIEEWGDGVIFRVTKPANEGDPDDALVNDALQLVFSARFQAQLKAEGIQGIQFLPVRVFHVDGSLLPGYAIANILNLIEALDLKRSVYDRTPEDFPQADLRGKICVSKPVLIGEKIQGLDIFRLREEPFEIFVSEKFRKVCLKGKFTGIGFDQTPVSGVENVRASAPAREDRRVPEPAGSDLDEVASIVSKAGSAKAAWGRLAAWCERKGLDWSAGLGAVAIAEEVDQVCRRLTEIFSGEPVPKTVRFFNFGLFDMTLPHSHQKCAGFYVSGGEDFDPEDSDSLCDLPYFPEQRIIRSGLLDRVRLWASSRSEHRALIEYAVMFGAAAVLAKFGLPGRTRLRLVVSFDEGDSAEIRRGAGGRLHHALSTPRPSRL